MNEQTWPRGHGRTPTAPVLLGLEAAEFLEGEVRTGAGGLGIAYSIAVLDGSARIVRVTRMDGTALRSIETAVAKARTSVYFTRPTAELTAAVQPGAPDYTMQNATAEPLLFIGGGAPIIDDRGVVIGALGAAGGTPDQDHRLVVTAVAAWQAVAASKRA